MRVLQIENVANVSYLLAHGLEKYQKCKSYLVMSANLPYYHEPYYGYDSGNPYKVDILYTKGGQSEQVKRILPFVLKEGIDIIHFHCIALTTDIIAKVIRCKVVRHFHGSDLRLLPERLRSLYSIIGEHKILVSTSDLMPHVWTRAIPHTELFPNPVDPAIHEAHEPREEENTVFLPTRHDERIKRTSIAFDAWSLLKKLNPKAKLKTIMFGRDAKRFRKMLAFDDRITWLPLMTRQRYMQQLKSSAVVWGQFELGSLGQTELEAMAAGKPVITYWKERPSERCPPPLRSFDSPRTIAIITDFYLRNETSRKKLGASLQKWCLGIHSLEKVSRRLYEIYREL